MDDPAFAERAARIEALVEAIEAWPDAGSRTQTIDLLQLLLQLYGEGLARMMDIVAQRDAALLHTLAQDDVVAHLLLLHDLHPLPVETRVALGLEEARPVLQSQGGRVEFLGLEGGMARVRLHESCRSSPVATVALEQTIEDVIQKVAPDLDGVVTEKVIELPLVP
jgi:Fe-S cluster biogenesis protein NfuA